MRPLLLLLPLLGCQAEPFDSIHTRPDDNFAASVQAVQSRMHLRFAAAQQTEQAIAASDLERARTNAHVISELDEPEALAVWQPYIVDIRNAARQVESAGDVIAAAHTMGTLGMKCAQCHVAIKARVKFPEQPRPSDDPKLAPQMLGHQWAAVQMWEGLIGPSNERWNAGAQALTAVPLNIVAQATTPAFAGDVDDVARIRLYARRAVKATSDDARAAVFGDLLATCAHCHAILRDR
ncbi:hypothetical protein BH11MYX2_BH11MYX2_11100 [soil metagenome]